MRSRLHTRILIAFLLLSLIPLSIAAFFLYFNVRTMETGLVSHIAESLEQGTRQRLEGRAREVASQARSLLLSCERDLNSLSLIPVTEPAYETFARLHTAEVRERSGPRSVRSIPLYREIAFIDPTGRERIRIVDAHPDRTLRDVSNPAHTTYHSEEYFAKTMALPAGAIYVSHVTGFHVDKQAQLGSATRIEDARDGAIYEGVVRFARTVKNAQGTRAGMIVLSLDHRHLMELTQHIDPLGDSLILFPSYETGNYAFAFDDEGWIITHPKFWDIRGLDENGVLVPPYSEESSPADIARGRIPFNLFRAGFIHPNYPLVAREVLAGRSGSVTTTNVGGVHKVMAYAPIPYHKGGYSATGVFGGITIGTEINRFHTPALAASSAIDRIVSFSINGTYVLIAIAALAAILASFLFSRRLTEPIRLVMQSIRSLGEGKRSEPIAPGTTDEIGELSDSVNRLAWELSSKQERLDESFSQLERSRTQLATHARELEHRLHLLEEIQQISDLLGTTFDIDRILPLILRTCVDGMGFERAVLYLLNKKDHTLSYREGYGFTPDQEARALAEPFRPGVHDCVETRVIRSRHLIAVDHIDYYPGATPMDIRIRQGMESCTFAYAPLMVQEDVIGILGVDRSRSRERLSETELHSLQILANHAARVIEMSRLYGEIFEERASLDSIFQSMLAGIIALDAAGAIRSMNATAERWLGVASEDLVGRPLEDAFAADPDAARNIRHLNEWGAGYARHELHYLSGGDERTFYVSTSRIHSRSHETLGSIILIQDITEKKQFDDHMGRMERLASLGRLAAGVAHEIRNPLTGLSLMLDRIHDTVQDQSLQSQLEGSLNVIERIERLVSQLLAGASPAHEPVQACAVNRILENTIELVNTQVRRKGITTRTDIAPDLQPVAGDPQRLSQAFLNIMLNALQAMPEGGTLNVTSREIGPDLDIPATHVRKAHARNSSVMVTISDSGPGIPRDIQQRIFEPFFTTKRQGTGLGLYITHQVITDHGGEIFVSTVEPHGTMFSIYLPVNGIA